LEGDGFPVGRHGPPAVAIGGVRAHVRAASSTRLRVLVPADAPDGLQPITIADRDDAIGEVRVASSIATGIHMVDSPVFDRRGRLYVTQSGTRGVRVPVPLYRVRSDGGKDPVAVDIANATSMAAASDGGLFVSSRFDGHVYRLTPDDRAEVYASDLGVPTGLAVAADGTLYVGDRSGTVFRVTVDRHVEPFATLPASVAAFHLAFGPDDALYVTAPTLSSHDVLYRISRDRLVDTVADGFGRPQGLAFDHAGRLYVVDALAGAAGVYRLDVRAERPVPEFLVAAAALVGVAFDPAGGLVLAASDAVWRLDVPLSPLMSHPDA
jgi:sugar lactone lactonase YvrE